LKELTQIKTVSWIKFLVYGALLVGIYYSAFTWMVTKDWAKEAYSYCWLIPPVVLYLIWIKREKLRYVLANPSWIGLIPIGLGLLFFCLGELSGEFFTLYISFWLIFVGLCWVHMGWLKLKTIGFPLLFMLTMFPLPNFINTKVMLQLRLISSKLGVAMIKLFGLPVYREGNIIDLGFAKLQIVNACSGLHSLISLLVLCLLLVYFFKAHFWKRLVLFVSAIPLAILTNSMRIAVTAILYKYFGAEVAQEFFHEFSGLAIFLICIPVLIIEMKLLEKLPPKEQNVSSKAKNPKASFPKHNTGSESGKVAMNRVFFQPVFIVVVLLLGTTLTFSRGIEYREKTPVKEKLSRFPLKVGWWSADRRQSLNQNIIDELDLSEYVIIDYQNNHGRTVNFYVAYYESQRKGESIHSPATCLPGGGWTYDQYGPTTISGIDGSYKEMTVNRALIQQGRHQQISYYWFPQRGRILHNAYQLKIYNFWDALTMQRTDGALVRLITPVYDDEKLEDAEARLQNFVRDIVPVLEKYIPGKELADSS